MVFQWPYIRQHYDGIDNPMYDQDIQVAMEAVLQAAVVLLGLGPNDFAIISGMDFDGQTNYTAGWFYLNGTIYYMPAGFTTGQALGPNVISGLDENFDDTQSRTIYSLQQAVIAAQGAATTPNFAGDMNQYRIGGKFFLAAVTSLLATQALLKQAAFRDVGQVPGTVMAGDDPRAPYTAAQLDARYSQRINVIEKGTATPYTPAGPNDPVNKGYADSTYINVLAKGRTNIGDIPSGGISITVSFGITLPSTSYTILFTLVSLGTPFNDATSHAPAMIDSSKSTSSVQVRFQEGVGVTQNLAMDWIIIPH